MIELVGGAVAGLFMLGNTVLNLRMRRQMKVSNGIPPGYMIEKTYDTVHEIKTDLAVHKVDPKAHSNDST